MKANVGLRSGIFLGVCEERLFERGVAKEGETLVSEIGEKIDVSAGSVDSEETFSVMRVDLGPFLQQAENGEAVRLPDLPGTMLNQIGKAPKPLRLKPGIVAKNKANHPELVEPARSSVLANALYAARVAIQTAPTTAPDYWLLSSPSDGSSDNAVVELSETKDAFEVVGWYQMRDRSVEQKKKKAGREGGQVLMIASGDSAGLSDVTSDQDRESHNSEGESTFSLLPDASNLDSEFSRMFSPFQRTPERRATESIPKSNPLPL